MAVEDITRRAAAGLSKVDYALMGVDGATQEVVAVHPELGERPPAGLSKMEWAQMGLESAVVEVKKTTGIS